MELQPKLDMPPIRYLGRWPRWGLAMLVGVLMVYLSEPGSWTDLHLYDGFELAIAVSCAIAILLSKVVNYLSIWLDEKFDWDEKTVWRFVLQFLFGFLLPIGFAVFAIWYYFHENGWSLSKTTYFTRVFGVSCSLLIGANVYYPVHFIVQTRRRLKKANEREMLAREKAVLDPSSEVDQTLPEVMPVPMPLILPECYQVQDILLIKSIDRKLFSYSKAGEKLQWPITINRSIESLPQEDFFKINKSAIVHRNNIIQARYSSSKCIELLLNQPTGETILVSQRSSGKFCKWYKLKVLPAKPKN